MGRRRKGKGEVVEEGSLKEVGRGRKRRGVMEEGSSKVLSCPAE